MRLALTFEEQIGIGLQQQNKRRYESNHHVCSTSCGSITELGRLRDVTALFNSTTKFFTMVRENRIACGVRVKLSSEFKPKCLGDEYLMEEPVLFISEGKSYNDNAKGSYVMIRGGSLMNSGMAYLNEINLEFEVPERPLYGYMEKGGLDTVNYLLKQRDDLDERINSIKPLAIWNHESK